MTEQPSASYDPSSHYDRVTDAWRLLLGEDLHFGVFDSGDEPLHVATQNLTERMIGAARFTPSTRLLDIGCGTGHPACQVAGRFHNPVLGISTSQAGIDAARRRAAAAGLPHVEFELRDALDSGLPSTSFDRAWALESSHLMPDRTRLAAECARLVRPGGRVVICDLVRKREIPFAEVRARRREFATLRAAFGEAHFGLPSDYVRDFEDNGIEVDLRDDLSAATYATFDRWRTNLAHREQEVTELLGREGVAEFADSIRILESLWQDDTLGYSLIAGGKR